MEREQYSLFWEGNWALGKSTIGIHHIESSNEGRTLPLTTSEREFLKSKNFANLASAMNDPEFVALLPRPDRIMESTNTTYSAKYEVP